MNIEFCLLFIKDFHHELKLQNHNTYNFAMFKYNNFIVAPEITINLLILRCIQIKTNSSNLAIWQHTDLNLNQFLIANFIEKMIYCIAYTPFLFICFWTRTKFIIKFSNNVCFMFHCLTWTILLPTPMVPQTAIQ